MLQNDAVRNLHYDSEIRVAQQPERSQPRGLYCNLCNHYNSNESH